MTPQFAPLVPAYARLRLLAAGAGTFTPNIALDWSLQFSDSAVTTVALSTIAGEHQVDTVTTGVSIDLAWYSDNPYDFSFWVESSTGAHTQISMNGILSEISVSGLQTASALWGFNILKVTRIAAPLVSLGQLLSAAGIAPWHTLYPPGSDPFKMPTGGGLSPIGPGPPPV